MCVAQNAAHFEVNLRLEKLALFIFDAYPKIDSQRYIENSFTTLLEFYKLHL